MIRPIAFSYRKKYMLILLAAILLMCTFSGCGGFYENENPNEDEGSAAAGELNTPQPVPPNISAVNPPIRHENAAPSPSAQISSPGGERPGNSSRPEYAAAVSAQPEAEDEYFSDAAFVGNSLMDGFRLFSGLSTCDYYAATSMTVLGMDSTYAITLDSGGSGTIMQALAQKEYGKVYIQLGINEIGFETSYFKELYGKMLDNIAEIQPDADIYIMSLTPVSEHKSATSDIFNMKRINDYNNALYELAEEKGCYFLDICTALSDETGFLPSAVTSDGVHFSVSHYLVWLEYVKTHYV